MSHELTQPREIADARIQAMLEAFAGPAAPVRTAMRPRRRGTRRTVLLLIAALVLVGLAVPGALALLGRWETPKHFVADKSQPAYMREVIRQWMNAVEAGGWAVPPPGGYTRVTAIKTALIANTPDGQARVYAFRFTHGQTGSLAVLTRKPRLLAESGEAGWPPRPTGGCPPGWALQWLNGGTKRIGQTVGYVLGRASPRVASVHVLYRNGSTAQGAVGNGYFLAWMKPSAGRTNATLIAENTTGQTIARLVIRGSGHPAKPRSLYLCAP